MRKVDWHAGGAGSKRGGKRVAPAGLRRPGEIDRKVEDPCKVDYQKLIVNRLWQEVPAAAGEEGASESGSLEPGYAALSKLILRLTVKMRIFLKLITKS